MLKVFGRTSPIIALSLVLGLASIEGISFSAQQPPPIFAFQFGSTGHESGKALAVDSSGNVILAGYFQNSVDFDPGPGAVRLQNGSGLDMVIAKYDRIGRLIWAKDIGGNAEVIPRNVALDGNDNIYVAGEFGLSGSGATTADFDSGPGVANLTTSGGMDPFVAKYDSNGNFLWADSLGSFPPNSTDDRAWDLAVDSAGNVYFCGELRGTFDLIPSSSSIKLYTSFGGSDIFVEKLDNAGNFVWGFGIGGSGDDAAMSLALDGSGHLFVSGTFSYNVDFDPGPSVSLKTSIGKTDMFIARYTTAGQFDRAVSFGGPEAETLSPGGMRLDGSGNAMIAGQFLGSIDFDPGSGQHLITNASASPISFFGAYTPDLALRWVFPLSSVNGTNGITRVVADNQQNVWLTGYFGGTTDFDGAGASHNLTSKGKSGATDAFLAKYDKTGAFLWARGFGAQLIGADNFTAGLGMTLDRDNNVYLTGQFFGKTDFSPSPTSYAFTSVGAEDGFVIRYDALGNLLPTLYFPRMLGDSERFTGIAVANWGATPAEVVFTALDNGGKPLAAPAGIVNPKTITIPEGGQTALLAEQIFNLPFTQPRDGWIQAQSTSSQVTGFFLEGSTNLSFLDGAVADTLAYPRLFFSRGGLDASLLGTSGFHNRIDVVNPSPVKAQLSFGLTDESGRVLETAARALDSQAKLSEDLTSLFPSSGPTASKSYIAVTSGVGVMGYQSIDSGDSLFSLAGQPASTGTELASAQFASGLAGTTAYFTNLSLINTSSQGRRVQLSLIGNDGSPVGTGVSFVLSPGAHYQKRGDLIFGFEDPSVGPLREGTLLATADGPGIIGDVVFGDPIGRRFLASLPMDSSPGSSLVFSQVAEGDDGGGRFYFTGLAIYNPNPKEVIITLDVYSETGAKTGTAIIRLPAGNRISKTLPELVPSVTSQLRGYIRLSSSGGPVFAFELFGDQNLDFLAAVPPQPIEP